MNGFSDEVLAKMAERDAEVQKNLDAMMKENKALATRLAEMEKIAAPRRDAFSVPGLEGTGKEFSFLRAVNAIKTGDWTNAGFEKEVFEAVSKKAMAAGTDTAGGYIVPSEYIPELIEMLRANQIMNQVGATYMTGLTSSPVELPKQTGGATAYWVDENSAITESELTVGQIKMTPKAVAAMVKLSNRLIRMSNPAAEALVRRDIVQTLALAVDLACLRGSGNEGQPIGVRYTSGINSLTAATNGTTITFDHLIDLAYEVEIDNALRGNLSYIFAPAVRRQLIKSKVANYSGQTDGTYIVQPTSDAELAAWIGYPYKTTTQLAANLTVGSSTNCSEVYFGNWQELIIGQWAGMEIMASQETSDAFEKNQTWVRIIQEVDVAVRHPESFAIMTDARA